jgi:hypothetical protein
MRCDALLAIIGERWLDITDQKGQRRLDDPNDFVRLEVENALARDIAVVPVIVDKATVPRPEDLPGSLEQLAYRQSAVVRPDPDFDHDMERLTSGLDRLLRSRMGFSRGGAVNQAGPAKKLRYFCYISRSKVSQLYDQLPLSDREGSLQHGLKGFAESRAFARFYDGLSFGGRGRSDFADSDSIVGKLDTILNYIEGHEKVLDLARLCNEKARVPLDAFCYTYRGRFYNLGDILRNPDSGIHISGAALQRSRDDIILSKSMLIEPARTENSLQEIGPNKSRVVSNMSILCSDINEFTIRLACSYKFFSDMGGSSHGGEWSVHPHSGNHHFFQGEVDAWFEAVVFINGIRGNTILGTPLFLVHSFDPDLVL